MSRRTAFPLTKRPAARVAFAHSHTVMTLPSHTSILSGLLPYEHRMRDNSRSTLARKVGCADYATITLASDKAASALAMTVWILD